MRCPFCGEENTKVIDSRPIITAYEEDDSAIYAASVLPLMRR